MSEAVTAQMPRYKSYKEVWALKIKNIVYDVDLAKLDGNRETDGSATITPEEEGYAAFKVDSQYVSKHLRERQIDGYFVQYKDGYKSWSPVEAFETGYERV